MAEKVCSQCKCLKNLSEFYRDKNFPDGRRSYCKECQWQYQQSKSYKESKRKYRDSPNGRRLMSEWSKQRNQEHPEKVYAKNKIQRMFYSGKIPHPSTQACVHCGLKASDYHHPDYSKPLQVIALCRKCHSQEHRKENL